MKVLAVIVSRSWLVFPYIALLYASQVNADVRVLIKFNESDHHVERLVSVESGNPAFAAQQATQSGIEQNLGNVSVLWIGADGATLLTSSMDDPRLAHAPPASAELNPTLVSLNEGAYMVSGPSDSTILEIRLPANSSLALEAQIWQFELKP